MNAWLWGGLIAALLGLMVWGLASSTSREMPPYADRRRGGIAAPRPSSDELPKLAAELYAPGGERRRHVCIDCSHLQDVDSTGRLVDHDRPEPSVPFDTAPVHCEGSGRTA